MYILNLNHMQFFFIIKAYSFLVLIILSGCKADELTPYEKAKNPYGHLGVEGYMGAAMTTCLGMAPSGPPIRREKDGASVVADSHYPEQPGYFDCIDKEIYKVEEKRRDDVDD